MPSALTKIKFSTPVVWVEMGWVDEVWSVLEQSRWLQLAEVAQCWKSKGVVHLMVHAVEWVSVRGHEDMCVKGSVLESLAECASVWVSGKEKTVGGTELASERVVAPEIGDALV